MNLGKTFVPMMPTATRRATSASLLVDMTDTRPSVTMALAADAREWAWHGFGHMAPYRFLIGFYPPIL